MNILNRVVGIVFLLATLLLVCTQGHAANRFLTCPTTCTITAIDQTIWGAASGGTGATVPGSGDTVFFDAATCVGGTTCTISFGAGYNPTWISLTWGACTASTNGCIVDWSVNNNNLTVSGGSGKGIDGANTGTRKWLCGTGTFTFSATANNEVLWDLSVTTGLDAGSVFNTCTMNFTGSGTGSQFFAGGGKSYGTVTFAANGGGNRAIQQANTFATFNVAAPNVVVLQAALTVTNPLTITGTAANPVSFRGLPNVAETLNIAAASTGTWMTIEGITFGGNTFVSTNSLNLGRVTNISNTVPSTGGGSAPCIKC